MVVALARIIVSVTDLQRSLPFYEGVLGFAQFWSTTDIARLRSGEVELMLHERGAEASDLGVVISFAVEDVDAVTAAAASFGVEIVDEPEDQPWGERQSVVRDPDGHAICLVKPLVH